MHAKYLSVLHLPDGTARIAAMYDVVPLRHQPTDGRLALAVNGVYVHSTVTADGLAAEGEAWGVATARDLSSLRLGGVAAVVSEKVPDPRAHPGLPDDVGRFTSKLLAGATPR